MLLQAVFQVSLDLPAGRNLTALSNTVPASSTTVGDVTHVVYQPSPLMSTYLLALCVGQLVPFRNGELPATAVKVCCTAAHVRFLASVAPTRGMDLMCDLRVRSSGPVSTHAGLQAASPVCNARCCSCMANTSLLGQPARLRARLVAMSSSVLGKQALCLSAVGWSGLTAALLMSHRLPCLLPLPQLASGTHCAAHTARIACTDDGCMPFLEGCRPC